VQDVLIGDDDAHVSVKGGGALRLLKPGRREGARWQLRDGGWRGGAAGHGVALRSPRVPVVHAAAGGEVLDHGLGVIAGVGGVEGHGARTVGGTGHHVPRRCDAVCRRVVDLGHALAELLCNKDASESRKRVDRRLV
jgi:hypothetical protein